MPNVECNDSLYSYLLCSLFAWCVRRGTAVNLSGEQGKMAGKSRAASSEKVMRGNASTQGVKATQQSLSIKFLKFSFHVHISTLECLVLVAMNEIS